MGVSLLIIQILLIHRLSALQTGQAPTTSGIHSRRLILDGLLENYDPKISPHYDEEKSTVVSVQLYIYSVDSFREADMEYSLTVFLRQRWEDKRLAYTSFPLVPEPLELDSKIMAKVWVPDLYFTNEKTADFHLITVPNKLMHLYRNGTIFYSIRLSMTLSCLMNLTKYPLDSQVCDLQAESYSYTTDYLMFRWLEEGPVQYANDMMIPQFVRGRTTAEDCTKSYGGGVGNFTCIKASIVLERDVWYYVLQIYIPSTIIVILSWVSFWLDVDAIPARITLGVLTILTLTTQSSSLRNTLPKVSYIKAIDVWMAICLGFVFAALLEFAFVNVLSRRQRDPQDVCMKEDAKLEHPPDQIPQEDNITKCNKGQRKRQALYLDRVSRVLFPSVFIGLNLFYWLFYTVILS